MNEPTRKGKTQTARGPRARAGLLAALLACGAGVPSAQAAADLERYVGATVAHGQCASRPLSMIEDIRLNSLISRISDEKTTFADAIAHLDDARATMKFDCASVAALEAVAFFTGQILPRLTGPVSR